MDKLNYKNPYCSKLLNNINEYCNSKYGIKYHNLDYEKCNKMNKLYEKFCNKNKLLYN